MRILGLLLMVALAQSARAGDGVIEINEARVAAGGINLCDQPGYPASICESGSYRLTSNLHFPSASTAGVVISASDVTLDLNGMTIAGDNLCTGLQWVTACNQDEPAAIGVAGNSPNITVRNGRIHGAGGYGITLAGRGVAEDLTITDSGSNGLVVGPHSRVTGVTSVRNRSNGIFANESVVDEVVVAQNGVSGLYATSSTAQRVTARQNGYAGIVLTSSSSVSGFATSQNGANGVNAETASLVESGTVRNNGLGDSGHCGIWAGGSTGYRGVVVSSTVGGNTGTVCGGPVNLGGNSCQGGACPP